MLRWLKGLWLGTGGAFAIGAAGFGVSAVRKSAGEPWSALVNGVIGYAGAATCLGATALFGLALVLRLRLKPPPPGSGWALVVAPVLAALGALAAFLSALASSYGTIRG